MTAVLVAYATGEGQTATVAERIGSVLEELGLDPTTVRLSEAPDVAEPSELDVADFDAVLVGGPVNNRRHRPEVYAFVERNREALAARPSAFFQLSLASIVPWRWAREGAMDYVDSLVEETGWHPDRIGLFAGAVKYTQYDRWERLLFRLVSAVTTGDTDTSRDYEYTDWVAVERFAAEFADLVEAEGERAASTTGGPGSTLARLRRRRGAALPLAGLGLAGVAY